MNEQEIVKIKALNRIKVSVFQNEIAMNEDYYSLIIRIYTATFRKDVPLTPLPRVTNTMFSGALIFPEHKALYSSKDITAIA